MAGDVSESFDRVAIHEAGHTVAAVRLQIPLRKAAVANVFGAVPLGAVLPDEDSWDVAKNDPQRATEEKIIMTYAGPIAEKEITGDLNPGSAQRDQEDIDALSRQLSDPPEHSLSSLRERARGLVADELGQEAVRDIAFALKKGDLSDEAARTIVQRTKQRIKTKR